MGKYLVRKAKTGIMFRLAAGNGQVIGVSEVYSSKAACLNGVESVRKNGPTAAIEDQTAAGGKPASCPKFEIFGGRDGGEFYFRLRARNGEIILSSEGYTRKDTCLNGVESVRRNSESPIEEAE